DIVDLMALRTARDVHAGRDQHVALDVDQAEMTPGADVRPLADPRAGTRERRPEFDDGGVVTPVDGAAQKRPPKILAGEARYEGQQLRRRLDGAIAPDQ